MIYFTKIFFLFQLTDIDDGFATLMDDKGETKEDLKVPDNEIGKEITDKFEAGETFVVTVLSACGEESMVGTKVLN